MGIFSKQYVDYKKEKIEYPLLIVNCKSGISYYLVAYENGPLVRVLGSIMGESTLSGMTKLLMVTRKFKDQQKSYHPNKHYPRPTSEIVSESLYMGDSSKVDITVGDIYGPKGLPSLGLPAELLASCMSKKKKQGNETLNDYLKSMATMYCINLASI